MWLSNNKKGDLLPFFKKTSPDEHFGAIMDLLLQRFDMFWMFSP